ncbi:hypothetical protein PENTCL1PPCAC_23244, partial [Pristionchus entomophagus]
MKEGAFCSLYSLYSSAIRDFSVFVIFLEIIRKSSTRHTLNLESIRDVEKILCRVHCDLLVWRVDNIDHLYELLSIDILQFNFFLVLLSEATIEHNIEHGRMHGTNPFIDVDLLSLDQQCNIVGGLTRIHEIESRCNPHSFHVGDRKESFYGDFVFLDESLQYYIHPIHFETIHYICTKSFLCHSINIFAAIRMDKDELSIYVDTPRSRMSTFE